MIKYLLIFFVSLISCQAKNKTVVSKTMCDEFKKGEFFHRLDGDTTLYKIERNDTLQKETIVSTGDYVNAKIKWTSECEYELTFLNQHINSGDSFSVSDQQIPVKVKILRIEKDTCFIDSYEDGSISQSGVIFK